jgi:hypothetical protein
LRELALSLAAKAKEAGEEVSLRPMSARDRRTVHMTLKDDNAVTTQSRGEGMRRRVVIIPKNKKVTAPKPEEGAATPVEAAPDAGGDAVDEVAPEEAPEAAPAAGEATPEEMGNAAPPSHNLDDDIGNH